MWNTFSEYCCWLLFALFSFAFRVFWYSSGCSFCMWRYRPCGWYRTGQPGHLTFACLLCFGPSQSPRWVLIWVTYRPQRGHCLHLLRWTSRGCLVKCWQRGHSTLFLLGIWTTCSSYMKDNALNGIRINYGHIIMHLQNRKKSTST